ARLSHRYIPSRQLPDKAVSLIDTACARVAISQHATPPQVEDSRRQIEALQMESEILARETAIGVDHTERAAEIATRLDTEKQRFAGLEQAWKKEKDAVDKIVSIRAALRPEKNGPPAPAAAGAPSAPESAPPAPPAEAPVDPAKLRADLAAAEKDLR